MSRSLLLTAVILVTLVAAAAVQGQGQADSRALGLFLPFDFTGGGVRAEGMANACLALSDDIAGGTWNPAALVVHESPKLGIAYGSLSSKGNTDWAVASNTYHHEHSGSLSSVNGINFVAPFRVKGHAMVGSFNYSNSFEGTAGANYKVLVQENVFVIRNNIGQILPWDVNVVNEQQFEGSVNAVNFSLGTKIKPSLSVGLGVNIYSGQAVVSVDQVATLMDYPLPPSEQNVQIDVVTRSIDTSSFSGFNFTLGAKHDGERLNAALVIRTPFNLGVTTGNSSYRIRYINGLSSMEDSDTSYVDNQLAKYGIPLTVGLGSAYNLKENLVLAMDAEYRGYGNSKLKNRDLLVITPSGRIEEEFSEYDLNWNSGFALRFGAEYTLSKSFGIIPIRGGVGFIPTPAKVSADTDTPKLNAVIPHAILAPLAEALNSDDTPLMYTFSLGIGIHWSQIRFDWSYIYSRIDRDLESTDFLLGNRDHHIGFSFTGVF